MKPQPARAANGSSMAIANVLFACFVILLAMPAVFGIFHML
ncbi:MAG TPA: hypothetical protein VNZ27_09720 [Rhodanobacter sp.]|nr:hypothetical protein [Rhodanobacter sp.]